MHCKIAFVIATKDRPKELPRLLESLESQTLLPAQVIVVDGSEEPVKEVLDGFPNLKMKYLRCLPPSGTRQRNLGVRAVDSSIHLIGFLDDDVVLESDAVEKMYSFWDKVGGDVVGASLNMVNHPPLYASTLKNSFLISRLNLYSDKRGRVPKSGFQTMIGKVKETIFTEWLPTTASVWRRETLAKIKFDEWFEGYSYLEDLDFSYRVGKKWKLGVVSDAKFYHYPSSKGRGNWFEFGKREVINRIYFVRKNEELSLVSCFLAILGRIFISIALAFQEKRHIYYLQRVVGNLRGLIESF